MGVKGEKQALNFFFTLIYRSYLCLEKKRSYLRGINKWKYTLKSFPFMCKRAKKQDNREYIYSYLFTFILYM